MNTKLRSEAKNYFKKYHFRLMNHAVFDKTMENITKYRDIELVATNRKRSCLVLEPNYYKTKCLSENLLAKKMKIIKVKMNKPVYLGLSIWEISKKLI